MATGRLKCPFPYGSPVKMPTNTSERGSGAAAAWRIVMLIQTGLYSPRYWGIHNAPPPRRWSHPRPQRSGCIYTLLIFISFYILDAKYCWEGDGNSGGSSIAPPGPPRSPPSPPAALNRQLRTFSFLLCGVRKSLLFLLGTSV